MGTVHVDFVQIPFTVKDSKGGFVPDLTWRDVRIYENGLRQQMRYWSPDPFPLSVAFVIDQSMTQDTMDKINSSLSALQGAFAPYDEVAIYTYNNGVKEQTTFTAAQSNRLGVILERSKSEGRPPLMGWGGPLSQTTTKNNQQVDPNTAPVRNQQTMNPRFRRSTTCSTTRCLPPRSRSQRWTPSAGGCCTLSPTARSTVPRSRRRN